MWDPAGSFWAINLAIGVHTLKLIFEAAPGVGYGKGQGHGCCNKSKIQR
jgi:hypothetical protein